MCMMNPWVILTCEVKVGHVPFVKTKAFFQIRIHRISPKPVQKAEISAFWTPSSVKKGADLFWENSTFFGRAGPSIHPVHHRPLGFGEGLECVKGKPPNCFREKHSFAPKCWDPFIGRGNKHFSFKPQNVVERQLLQLSQCGSPLFPINKSSCGVR